MAEPTSPDSRIMRVLESHDWDADRECPEQLPLLAETRGRVGGDFDGWSVLFIQHHLGSTIPMVQAFVDAGVAVDRIWHIDVPYSTDHQVNDVLVSRLGRPDAGLPRFDNPLVDYAPVQIMRTSQVLHDIAATRPERLLVVDDGAYALRTLLMLREIGDETANLLRGAAIVEQTTRGHRFLEASQGALERHDATAVSVARARTKLEFEAPFVGGAVTSALLRQAGDAESTNVLTLGYGAVGRACVAELRRRLPSAAITVVDPKSPMADDPQTADVRLLQKMPHSGDFDLVLGCTGGNSFGVRDIDLVGRAAVLASASSADVEFGRAAFVEAADRYPDDEFEVLDPEGTRAAGIHAPVMIRSGHKSLTFVNAGFPVNFDGGPEGLSPTMIQPTRCLLYAAAVQASKRSHIGVQGLSAEDDTWLLSRALESLA
jgi:S-adenosylhomocysteine hydrolase